MSKVISIYNERERAGSTTTAITLAVIFSWYANKKTLLINFSQDNAMEQYLSDVKVRYGLVYLKALKEDLRDIKMFTTQVNDNLSVIGYGELEDDDEFIDKLLGKARKEYEIIILDLSNSIRKEQLNKKANIILGLMPFDISKLDIENEDKRMILFNAIPSEAKDVVKEMIDEKVKNSTVVTFNTNIWYQISMRDSIYSYLIENMNSNNSFINQQLEVAEKVIGEKFKKPRGFWRTFINKLKRGEENEF